MEILNDRLCLLLSCGDHAPSETPTGNVIPVDELAPNESNFAQFVQNIQSIISECECGPRPKNRIVVILRLENMLNSVLRHSRPFCSFPCATERYCKHKEAARLQDPIQFSKSLYVIRNVFEYLT